MFYIHQNTCISPQQTFLNVDIKHLCESADNKLTVIEPGYEGIPPSILRRMGKAVRIGVGAALPLVKQVAVDGIIIGTANGGMEDCIKFLNQIIQYEEGMLAPGNFVQSTPNSIAAQVGLLTANKGYNITHVHRGLAFENALLDAAMLLRENPAGQYLLGGVDEISAYNYNIDNLGGWFKNGSFSSHDLFVTDGAGTLAGEGSAMFIVNNEEIAAEAFVQDANTLHTDSEQDVAARLEYFLEKNLANSNEIDLLLSGENGDSRFKKYFETCESILRKNVQVARFKHMSGEYATASSMALWLSCQVLREQQLPTHMIKKRNSNKIYKRILIYNNYKGNQHSFILLAKP